MTGTYNRCRSTNHSEIVSKKQSILIFTHETVENIDFFANKSHFQAVKFYSWWRFLKPVWRNKQDDGQCDPTLLFSFFLKFVYPEKNETFACSDGFFWQVLCQQWRPKRLNRKRSVPKEKSVINRATWIVVTRLSAPTTLSTPFWTSSLRLS